MTARDNTNNALAAERVVADEQYDTLQQSVAALQNTINVQAAEIIELKKQIPPPVTPTNNRLALSSVQVFPNYPNLYGDHPKVFAALKELGIKRIRHQVVPNMPADSLSFLKTAWADYGIKSWLTVGKPRVVPSAADYTAMEATLKDLAPSVERIDNWNEPNHQRNATDPSTANWVANTNNHQKKIKAMGTRLGIKVGTPQLWSGSTSTQWNDLSALVAGGLTKADYDVIVWHLYPRSATTQAEVDTFLGQQEKEFRTRLNDQTTTICCSEYGWFTAPNYTGGAVVVTEAQRAQYLPLFAKWYTSRGYGHSVFELVNDADPSGANREAWLGLIHTDWSRTAGFTAYKNFLAGA